MIKWLLKYGAVIFLLNTILLSIDSTRAFGDIIFLVLMLSYAVVLLMNPHEIKNVILNKAFSFFLILNFINLFYFLIFHSISDIDAIKYMLARAMQFSIISFSIYFNFEYYKSTFLYHLSYVILSVVILGLIFNFNLFGGRYSGIVWNSNMLASLTSIAFSVLFLSDKKKSLFDVFLIMLLFIVSLSTGSRGVLVAFFLAFLFKYGFTNRNIIYAFFALAFYFVIVNMQLDTSINRFSTQSLLNDRLLQYKYAYETILKQPFFGFGLDKYAYIDSKVIPYYIKTRLISAHNGYLAILTQYGIVFGSFFFFIIFKKIFSFLNSFRTYTNIEKIYLFIIIYAVFAALYETMITGINEFHTILFWFSLAFLSFSKIYHEYEN